MGRSFNGSSDVITTTLNTGNQSATISAACWLYASTPGGNSGPIQGTANHNIAFVLTSTLHLQLADVNFALLGAASTGAISTGVWTHVGWAVDTTANSNAVTYYINGAASGTSSSGGHSLVNGVFSLGVTYTGQMADAAVWSGVLLGATDFAKLAAGYRPVDVNSANLVGWWPLSGYSSPEPDISGNANGGTLTGTSAAPMPPSISRGGRNFNGSSDIVTIGTPSVLNITSTISVSVWVFPVALPALGNNQAIFFSKGYDGTDEQYTLRLSGIDINGSVNGKWVQFLSFNGATSVGAQIQNAVAANAWYHVIGTVDGSNNWNIYVNGSNAGQATLNSPRAITGSTAQVSFGAEYISGAAARFLQGNIADAAVWNTNLNTTQISALAAGARPNSILPGNLVGWWPCNGFTNTTENDLSGNSNNGTLTGTLPILGPPATWRLG
jgi:hypothetical protein